MKKIIIGLIGRQASGKEVVKQYLIKKYGADAFKYSSPLRDILNRLYIPLSRENLQELSYIIRKSFGEDSLMQTIFNDLLNSTSKITVIDGVRRMMDLEKLKDMPHFYLINIDAEVKLRYERLKLRNENEGDSEKSYEDFLADDNRESEQEISTVASLANFQLDNNTSFEKLYEQVDKVMEKIQNT